MNLDIQREIIFKPESDQPQSHAHQSNGNRGPGVCRSVVRDSGPCNVTWWR